MALCPYCNSEIDETILRNGGECPSCLEDILGGIFVDQTDESNIDFKDISNADNLDLNSMNLKDSLFDVHDTPDADILTYSNNSFVQVNEAHDHESNDIDLLSSEIEILSPPTNPKEEIDLDVISNLELDKNGKEEDLYIPIGNTNPNVLKKTGFLDEEETEITISSLFPKDLNNNLDNNRDNIKSISSHEERDLKNVLPSAVSTAPLNQKTTLDNKAVVPDSTPRNSERSMKEILLQSSGVERDVINSLKDHPFIDEEYIPVQEDLFDNEEISIIENFAFEEVSEVQDIRKLYGVDESILFPSEQTQEIGLLHVKNILATDGSNNDSKDNLPPEKSKLQPSNSSRFHSSKDQAIEENDENEENEENDDLVLDEDMINDIDAPERNQVSPNSEKSDKSLNTIKGVNVKQESSVHSDRDLSQEIKSDKDKGANKDKENKEENFDKIPDWVEDDWGDDFLDEELTEVTELESPSNDSNLAEVIRPDFQTSSKQNLSTDKNPISKDMSKTTPKRNTQQPRALTTSTIILYILCFLLIVCISMLGFHLLGSE